MATPVIDFHVHETTLAFWETCRPWLLKYGYRLYRQHERNLEVYPTELSGNPGAESMYAYRDEIRDTEIQERPFRTFSSGRVTFAQDIHQRHVALKLVVSDSDEHRILCLLLEEQEKRGTIIPGVVPIVELLPFKDHVIAVMPRWGEMVTKPWFGSVHDVLLYMENLISGLAFLHSRRVVHRDVEQRNFLVNHIPKIPMNVDTLSMRHSLRNQGQLRYAIFDFDVSILLPAAASIKYHRLPHTASWIGALSGPPDLSQGEYDYDPFAYDVGILGIEFCTRFQHLTQTIPMLAPLLDKMVTRNVESRFTAEDALSFLRDRRAEMDDVQLMREPEEFRNEMLSNDYDTYDRWEGLPPDFIHRWSHLREPKLPCRIQVLRWLCSFPWIENVVRFLRKEKDRLYSRIHWSLNLTLKDVSL